MKKKWYNYFIAAAFFVSCNPASHESSNNQQETLFENMQVEQIEAFKYFDSVYMNEKYRTLHKFYFLIENKSTQNDSIFITELYKQRDIIISELNNNQNLIIDEKILEEIGVNYIYDSITSYRSYFPIMIKNEAKYYTEKSKDLFEKNKLYTALNQLAYIPNKDSVLIQIIEHGIKHFKNRQKEDNQLFLRWSKAIQPYLHIFVCNKKETEQKYTESDDFIIDLKNKNSTAIKHDNNKKYYIISSKEKYHTYASASMACANNLLTKKVSAAIEVHKNRENYFYIFYHFFDDRSQAQRKFEQLVRQDSELILLEISYLEGQWNENQKIIS